MKKHTSKKSLLNRSYFRGYDDVFKNSHRKHRGLPSRRTKKFFYNVSDNKLFDTDIIKKSNISSNKYRKNRNKIIKQRQLISSPGDNLETQVGKAYGSNNYQTIGDGVYILNNELEGASPQKSKMDFLKENLPDTTKSLTTIIGNLEKEDSKIIDDTNQVAHFTPGKSLNLDETDNSDQPDSQNDDSKAMSNHMKSRHHNPLGSLSLESSNVEGVVPDEMKMINQIEKSLGEDDKATDEKIKNHEDSFVHTFAQMNHHSENNLKHIENAAKAVENSDNEFIRNNPITTDPFKMTENSFKKDKTISFSNKRRKRKNRKHGKDLEYLDEAIGSEGSGTLHTEVSLGGSRTHRKHNKRHHGKKRHKKKEEQQTNERGGGDNSENADTGFFMSDDQDSKNLHSDKTIDPATLTKSADNSDEVRDATTLSDTETSTKQQQLNSEKKFNDINEDYNSSSDEEEQEETETSGSHILSYSPASKASIANRNIFSGNRSTIPQLFYEKEINMRKKSTPTDSANDIEDVSFPEVAHNQARKMFGIPSQNKLFEAERSLDAHLLEGILFFNSMLYLHFIKLPFW